MLFRSERPLVEVLPHAQVGEVGILTVDGSIAVGALCGECFETIGCFADYIAIGIQQGGGIAEEFGAVINTAVAVSVQHEEAIASSLSDLDFLINNPAASHGVLGRVRRAHHGACDAPYQKTPRGTGNRTHEDSKSWSNN